MAVGIPALGRRKQRIKKIFFYLKTLSIGEITQRRWLMNKLGIWSTGRIKSTGKNCSTLIESFPGRHCVLHKSHMDRPGIEPGSGGERI